MALLNYKAPVDYEAQLDAFRGFLNKFETSKTAQDEAVEAIDGLNLDGDHTSDEYDFMDDVADGAQRDTSRRPTKRKYIDMLQEVANRDRSQVLIELDDLKEVTSQSSDKVARLIRSVLVRRLTWRRFKPQARRIYHEEHQTLSRHSLGCCGQDYAKGKQRFEFQNRCCGYYNVAAPTA